MTQSIIFKLIKLIPPFRGFGQKHPVGMVLYDDANVWANRIFDRRVSFLEIGEKEEKNMQQRKQRFARA